MNHCKNTLFSIILLIFVFYIQAANALESNGNRTPDNNPSTETVGDFNHDGYQDLAVNDAYHHTETLYLNNGNGGFRAAAKASSGINTPQIQLADLNADGKPDLISTNSGSGGFFVTIGLGNGRYNPRIKYLSGVKPLSVRVKDFNNDNKLDLAAINFDQNLATLLYGDGNGNFTAQETNLMVSDLLSPLLTAEQTQFNPVGSADSSDIEKADQTQNAQVSAASQNLSNQPDQKKKALTVKAAPTTAALEKSVLQKINAYRVARKLPSLPLNTTISNVARTHSLNMASGKIPFGHQGFQARVQTLAKTFTFRAAAENVAMNQGYSDPAATAVNGWLKSTGHRNNIIGNYNLTGIGVAKNAKGQYFFTQVFWRR
ncbi:hypothetical protein MCAMS1_01821 [biofilm metagenome]